jgi:threonine synthase
MDILISSNLERLLYLLFDCERCSALMKELNECGRYQLSQAELAAVKESFVGYFTDEELCMSTIRATMEKEKRLIDTHTSVALSAAERYMSASEAKLAMLIVSTASAYKFAGDVVLSLTGRKPENDLDAPAILNSISRVDIPKPLVKALNSTPVHLSVCAKGEMDRAVFSFVG